MSYGCRCRRANGCSWDALSTQAADSSTWRHEVQYVVDIGPPTNTTMIMTEFIRSEKNRVKAREREIDNKCTNIML